MGGVRSSSLSVPRFSSAHRALIGEELPRPAPCSTVPAHRLTGLQVGPASWSKKVRAPKGSDPPNEAGGHLLAPMLWLSPQT